MRRSAGFGLNLPNLTPIPSYFLEHVSKRTLFDGRGIKIIAMDFPLPIPACCRASGNRNWEDAGMSVPAIQESPAMLY